MALYDGFFDAVVDEKTGQYDRTYGSEDFTKYFAYTIGSGVCVHSDPNSFKVRMENGSAVISPGYLFIRGYWLKNNGDYTVPLSGTSPLAIAATLNMASRMIELGAVPTAGSYPDSLVLALANPTAGTTQDTRHNADICGVIDTAGALSQKVEWALNYIDTQVESKLNQAQADIQEKSGLLDAKIAAAQDQTERLSPLPVGAIKFSVGNPGASWLLCNGGTFSVSTYPELNTALSGNTLPHLSLGDVPAYIKAKEG